MDEDEDGLDQIGCAVGAAADETSVTLRAVARRVGISAPSIYRHFADQPSIVLAVVQQAFDELEAELRRALDAAGADPRARLFAVCTGYLEFARKHPGRYRTMFGGLWMPDLEAGSVTEADLHALGQGSMQLLAEVLADCVGAGIATSTDLSADAVALWVGLHGLAQQQSVTVSFPWPPDITERLVGALAHLTDGGGWPSTPSRLRIGSTPGTTAPGEGPSGPAS